MENYVLKMEGITKEYFGNKVLKGVELKVRPGEIHASWVRTAQASPR